MPNELLTPDLIATIAGRAHFFFQVQQFQFKQLELQAYSGGVSPYFGDGVPILDEMIALKSRPFPWITTVRLDTGNTYSNLLEMDVTDLEALKAEFINIWGNVAKPNVYPPLSWN